jgi:putative transposase
MQKTHLELSAVDREFLQRLVKKSSLSVKVFQRAQGLLALDAGQSLQQVAVTVGVNYNTVAVWRDRYKQDGLALLEDKPRSGRPPHIDGTQRAKVTALACSTPPQGHARWSLRLLADRVVELGYVEAISHKHIGTLLKKTTSNRT